MRYIFSIVGVFWWAVSVNAQATYSELIQKAQETMNTSEDTGRYQVALGLYEEAFKKFPDSIDGTGLYYSSVLAADLKKYDQAFEYLGRLAAMETDEEGDPGWSYVLSDWAQEKYKNLLDRKRWKALERQAAVDKAAYFKVLEAAEKEFFDTAQATLNPTAPAEELYRSIRAYDPYVEKRQQDYSIAFRINDSTTTSYLVHLPADYDPRKQYPALIFLHGGVRYSTMTEYQTVGRLAGWERYYTYYAALNDIVLIFPGANKAYNWMVPDDGFYLVPEIIKQVRSAINLDDNKIFISGHSNGATGSFSYLMKQPTPFAGFYGFNTNPEVLTGGTFVENIKNRSFINFSTDQDYYYPPSANDSLNQLMEVIGADYQDYRYNGFPHWFPAFDESEPAYQILFSDLTERTRDPFPDTITWEFDDDTYGNVDWLLNIQLDTLSPKKEWHQPRNFTIDRWLEYDEQDSLVEGAVDQQAFDFPRKSGKIVAEYADNVFRVNTSRIRSFDIAISPEMVDMEKDIKVYVNDTLYATQRAKYDKELMMQRFEQHRDRTQVWVDYIELSL